MVKAIEKSVIGTRTAIYDLIHPCSGRKIRMLGMIHSATPSYYKEIQTALDDCDVVFYEGVSGKIVRWITLAYRIPTWFFSNTGLVGQRDSIDMSRKGDTICKRFVDSLDTKVDASASRTARTKLWKRRSKKTTSRQAASSAKMSMEARFDASDQWTKAIWTAMEPPAQDPTSVTRRLVHADMSGEVFAAGWGKLDWKFRVAILLLCPLFGLALAFSKRLRKWAFERQTDVEDLSPQGDAAASWLQLVLHDRDQVMIEKIEAFWDAEPNHKGQAAGVFGAAHLPAIISHLVLKRGFQITGSRWVVAIPAQ